MRYTHPPGVGWGFPGCDWELLDTDKAIGKAVMVVKSSSDRQQLRQEESVRFSNMFFLIKFSDQRLAK